MTPSPESLAEVAARLAALAEAEPHREICGLVEAGADGALRVVPLANRAPDPADAFEIDPADVLAALRRVEGGAGDGPGVLLAVYHSHPRGGAGLSASDLDQALVAGGPLLPGVAQVVVALQDGRADRVCWHRWEGGRYRPIDLWRRAG